MPAATDNGKPAPTGHWKDAGGKSALIGHSSDWFPGDGITDVIARMPDGKLYVYQGDGNGRFDISRRTEILLPAGAPNPATLTQIVVVPDMNGDNAEDIFATGGDTLWILTGYTGASITEARQLSATSWTKRDIVDVRDVSGDGVPDLVFRDDADPNRGLALRRGKPGTGGGAHQLPRPRGQLRRRQGPPLRHHRLGQHHLAAPARDARRQQRRHPRHVPHQERRHPPPLPRGSKRPRRRLARRRGGLEHFPQPRLTVTRASRLSSAPSSTQADARPGEVSWPGIGPIMHTARTGGFWPRFRDGCAGRVARVEAGQGVGPYPVSG
ncbi:FG-GAP repeat domain-containing protein [Streptomyces sp. NPDC054865]